MAAVSVFVDDAIRGDLPLVCAKTGEPTDLVIRMRQRRWVTFTGVHPAFAEAVRRREAIGRR